MKQVEVKPDPSLTVMAAREALIDALRAWHIGPRATLGPSANVALALKALDRALDYQLTRDFVRGAAGLIGTRAT